MGVKFKDMHAFLFLGRLSFVTVTDRSVSCLKQKLKSDDNFVVSSF